MLQLSIDNLLHQKFSHCSDHSVCGMQTAVKLATQSSQILGKYKNNKSFQDDMHSQLEIIPDNTDIV